jgi:DNA polymerase-3 subunit alpha
MAAMMTSVSGDSNKLGFYIEVCRQMHIPVRPPSVNRSGLRFAVDGDEIIFSLSGVKNVGTNAINAILEARKTGPFTSLLDFCQRVDTSTVNRKVIESLILCGAFDNMGARRSQMMAVVESCMAMGGLERKRSSSSQLSMFDLGPELPAAEVKMPDIPEFATHERLDTEKQLLGTYVSGHPLDQYRRAIEETATASSSALEEMADRAEVTIAGLITGIRKLTTKTGKPMMILTLEDMSGSVEVVLFSEACERNESLARKDQVMVVIGKVSHRGNNTSVTAEKLTPIANDREGVVIEIHADDERLKMMRRILSEYHGHVPLYLHVVEQQRLIRTDPQFWVDPHPDLIREMERLFGEGSVKYTGKDL